MRKIVFTNTNGVSTTFGETSTIYSINSLEGLGSPDVNDQEQKAPFQDGATNIDQLLEPRDIVMEGIIMTMNLPLSYQYRRSMCSALNTKLGPGTITYTNDYGSWIIYGKAEGPIFANNNGNEGCQKYQVTFHCADPYWQDVTETTVTLTTGLADKEINILGDVSSSFEADITGLMRNVILAETFQEKYINYNSPMDQKLNIKTGFGVKDVRINYDNVWRTRSFGEVYSVCHDGKLLWCAVGKNAVILTSPDGITWTSQTSGTTAYLYGIAYSAALGQWCAVGGSSAGVGVILTSPDGITWTSRTSGTTSSMRGIAYSSALGQWCAVGDNGVILTSPDGVTWTSQTIGTTEDLRGIAYSAAIGQWCAAGDNGAGVGAILTSPDGVTWTSRTSPPMSGIAYSAALGQWCAVGDNGVILTSSGDESISVMKDITSGSSFFHLLPGRNILSISVAAGNATAIVRFRNRYIGV